jgi:hypothetical protein
MVTSRAGASRAVIGPDIHGETLFSEAQYIANAAEVGSVGRGMASSGLTASGGYTELTAGLTYRTAVSIYNSGAQLLFVGPSGNGVAHMYPIPTGNQISFSVTSGVKIYGLTEGSNTNVRVVEIG